MSNEEKLKVLVSEYNDKFKEKYDSQLQNIKDGILAIDLSQPINNLCKKNYLFDINLRLAYEIKNIIDEKVKPYKDIFYKCSLHLPFKSIKDINNVNISWSLYSNFSDLGTTLGSWGYSYGLNADSAIAQLVQSQQRRFYQTFPFDIDAFMKPYKTKETIECDFKKSFWRYVITDQLLEDLEKRLEITLQHFQIDPDVSINVSGLTPGSSYLIHKSAVQGRVLTWLCTVLYLLDKEKYAVYESFYQTAFIASKDHFDFQDIPCYTGSLYKPIKTEQAIFDIDLKDKPVIDSPVLWANEKVEVPEIIIPEVKIEQELDEWEIFCAGLK